MKLAEILPNSR